jgi:hypothetical protein
MTYVEVVYRVSATTDRFRRLFSLALCQRALTSVHSLNRAPSEPIFKAISVSPFVREKRSKKRWIDLAVRVRTTANAG